jgi:hypothetical protein
MGRRIEMESTMKKIEYQEFLRIIDRLETGWGPLTDELRQVYYSHLRKYEDWVLKKAINEIYATYELSRFPKPAVIIQTCEAIRGFSKKDDKPIYCDKCDGGGLRTIEYTQNGTIHSVAFRCDCENGDKLRRNFPAYSEMKARLGLPDPPIKRLPSEEYLKIRENPDVRFDAGVDIRAKCKNCGSFYYVRFEGPTTGRDIWGTFNNGINLCERCYREKGREMGYWR